MLRFLQLAAHFCRLFSVLKSQIDKPLTCVTHVVHVPLASDPSITDTNSTSTLATVSEFRGANTQGVSHLRLDFAIDGVVPVHTHPLAGETLLVLKGSIYTGFIRHDFLYASTLQVEGPHFLPKRNPTFPAKCWE